MNGMAYLPERYEYLVKLNFLTNFRAQAFGNIALIAIYMLVYYNSVFILLYIYLSGCHSLHRLHVYISIGIVINIQRMCLVAEIDARACMRFFKKRANYV